MYVSKMNIFVLFSELLTTMSWPAQTPDLNPTENLLLVSDCYLSNVKVKTSIPRCMKTDWKSLNSSEVSSLFKMDICVFS